MNHDAISVQMCFDADLSETETDALLTRIDWRYRSIIDAQTTEIAGARSTTERWKERHIAVKQEAEALKRDITNYIRIGNEQGAEIARLRDAQAWQPIKTAPKDGTEILVWRSDCGQFIASYTSASEFPMSQSEIDELDEGTLFAEDWFTQWPQAFRLEGSEVPTHWMPLPAAPVAPSGENHD